MKWGTNSSRHTIYFSSMHSLSPSWGNNLVMNWSNDIGNWIASPDPKSAIRNASNLNPKGVQPVSWTSQKGPFILLLPRPELFEATEEAASPPVVPYSKAEFERQHSSSVCCPCAIAANRAVQISNLLCRVTVSGPGLHGQSITGAFYWQWVGKTARLYALPIYIW